MNTSHINALAAKAMGWERDSDGDYIHSGTKRYMRADFCWEPSDDLCDALELLKHVADGHSWAIQYSGVNADYWCQLLRHTATHVELAKAPTLCALRASPLITDDELNEALEDKTS
jgi:hypothetical protein